MQRKWIVAPVLAALIVAAAAAGLIRLRRNAAAQSPKQESAKEQPPAEAAEISLSGQIQARNVVKVPVPFEGRVLAFHAEAGAEVYEGQLLAEIQNEALDSTQQVATADLEAAQERVHGLEAAVSAARLEASRAGADALRARSEFDRASREYTRQKLLLAEGATPRLTFEKAEKEFLTLQMSSQSLSEVAKNAEGRISALQTDLDNARKRLDDKNADLEAVRARVSAGQIVSPATGVISARRGSVGETVHPGMDDLFRIATDLSNLSIIAEPSPAQLARIKPGQAVLINLADIPHEALGGIVRSTEDGRVTIDFSNPSPLVKPGHTAQVRIRLT
jgi:multidrug resistance efflux pump